MLPLLSISGCGLHTTQKGGESGGDKKERDMQGRGSQRQKGPQKTGVRKKEPLDGQVRAGKWRKHVEWMSGDPNDIGVCGDQASV